MVVIKKTTKKIRTLPCDDGCGTEVPVGDDAVGVVCSNCTHKRQMAYERTLDKSGEEGEDEGDENLTLEELNDRQENPVQAKPRRTRVPKGRGKVGRGKRSKKHPK